MKLKLNDKILEVETNKILLQLLEDRNINPQHSMVSINDEIIDLEQFSSIILKENDNIDIFTFVGGG